MTAVVLTANSKIGESFCRKIPKQFFQPVDFALFINKCERLQTFADTIGVLSTLR